MNIQSFAEVLADRQGGIYLKPGKTYKKELTHNAVMEIFGEVPEYTIRYGFVISVERMEDDKYVVAVRREK